MINIIINWVLECDILQYIAILRLCLILCYRDCHYKLSLHKCSSKKREFLSCLNMCGIQSMLSVQPTCFEERHPGPGSFCINVSQLPLQSLASFQTFQPKIPHSRASSATRFSMTITSWSSSHSINDGSKMRLALKSIWSKFGKPKSNK